jgi:glycosyltransferase involved in cell wall biosynthesis
VTHESILRPELLRELDRVGPVEIVIGIPSYNNARTIGHVVRAISAGLAKYYPDRPAVLVNSDGGSGDGTPERVLAEEAGEHRTLLVSHPAQPLHRLTTGYLGVPGKGSALRTIFNVAARVQARACAVVDADLRSINPHWVELLLEPVLREGMDFVAPLYARHKYDGTITNSIVYPLTRALYGRRIRQPIGGDFGFSGALAAHFAAADAWESDVARYGVDIWMTTAAVAGGFKVAQAYLGAKIHDTKDPGADLTTMFTQVVGTVFELMERHHGAWAAVQGSDDVPTFGFRYTVGVEPVAVNVERMVTMFRQGAADLMPVWRRMLSEETCAALAGMAHPDSRERLTAELWVRAVYEASASHHRGVLPRPHLLQAMIPLYLGRTAAFVSDTATAGPEDVETEIEQLCQLYERHKPYLIERWDARRA